MSPRGEALVRELALALPGVVEGTSYGTAAFRVRKKLFARMGKGGEWLVLKTDFDEREILMEADPETYFITDHYRNAPWVLVRLARVERDGLAELLEVAWRALAGKRLTG